MATRPTHVETFYAAPATILCGKCGWGCLCAPPKEPCIAQLIVTCTNSDCPNSGLLFRFEATPVSATLLPPHEAAKYVVKVPTSIVDPTSNNGRRATALMPIKPKEPS